jgi:hypothetical protein
MFNAAEKSTIFFVEPTAIMTLKFQASIVEVSTDIATVEFGPYSLPRCLGAL